MKTGFLYILSFIFSVFSYSQVDSVILEGKQFYIYPHSAQEPFVTIDFYKDIRYEKTRKRDSLSVNLWQWQVNSFTIDSSRFQYTYNFPVDIEMAERFPYAYYDNNIRSSNSQLFETEIPPIYDKIPDGDYIQYYKRLPYRHGDTLKFNYEAIAAKFHIEENQLHGPAVYYHYNGDTSKYGNYELGLKQGEWKAFTHYFDVDNLQKNSDDIDQIKLPLQSATTNFNKGLEQGTYVLNSYGYYSDGKQYLTKEIIDKKEGLAHGNYELTRNGQIIEKGHYKNGARSGEWSYYREKKQKARKKGTNPEMQLYLRYTLADSLITAKSPIIRGFLFETNKDTTYYGVVNTRFPPYQAGITDFPYLAGFNGYEDNMISFGQFYRIPNISLGGNYWAQNDDVFTSGSVLDYPVRFQSYQNNKSISHLYKRSNVIDSLGYQFLVTKYENFYPNGQLKFKFELQDGRLSKEEPIFWDNGNIASEINYNNECSCYEEKIYSYDGELQTHRQHSMAGKLLRSIKDEYGVTPMELTKANRIYRDQGTYLQYYNNNFEYEELTEKTIISESLFKSDSSSHELITLDPKTRCYTNHVNLSDGISFIHYELFFDSLYENCTGTKHIKFGNLECKKEFSGSIKNQIPQVIRNLPNPQKNIRFVSAMSFTFQMLSQWTYNGKPFDGKLNLVLNATEFSIRGTSKKVTIYHDESARADLLIYSDLLGELFYETFNDGYYQKINYKTVSKVVGNFEKGVQNKKWTLFNYKNQKLFDTQLKRGYYAGKTYRMTWPFQATAYQPIKPTNISYPTKPKWHLVSIINQNDSVLDGPSIHFNWKGDTTSWINYRNGIKQGQALENAIGYNLMIRNNYTNDSLHGVCYALNEQHDTLLLQTYTRGKLHGRFVFRTDSTLEIKNYLNNVTHGERVVYSLSKEKKSGLIYHEISDAPSNQKVVETYYKNGGLWQKTKFIAPLIYDYFEEFDSLGYLSKKTILSDYFVKRHEIWNQNILKMSYDFPLQDSLIFNLVNDNEGKYLLLYNGELTNYLPDFKRKWKGSMNLRYGSMFFTKYNSNASVKTQGTLLNGKKSGNWNYFDSEGKLLYQVDYFDTIIHVDDSLIFNAVGIYFDLNQSGEILSKSYIIELNEQFDCSHDEHYEIRTLYTFWEKESSAKQRNEYRKWYYDNGSLQSEGQMKKGLPTGIWKYYSPDGTLSQVGRFVNGKREGRWLFGDLGKVAYIGDFCIDPNTPKLEQVIKEQENTLRIHLRYYEKGKILSNNYFVVDKN